MFHFSIGVFFVEKTPYMIGETFPKHLAEVHGWHTTSQLVLFYNRVDVQQRALECYDDILSSRPDAVTQNAENRVHGKYKHVSTLNKRK